MTVAELLDLLRACPERDTVDITVHFIGGERRTLRVAGVARSYDIVPPGQTSRSFTTLITEPVAP